jgi:hypothetical protein
MFVLGVLFSPPKEKQRRRRMGKGIEKEIVEVESVKKYRR